MSAFMGFSPASSFSSIKEPMASKSSFVNIFVTSGVSYRAFYDIKVFLPWDIAVRSTAGWLTDLHHEKNFINSSNRTLP
jgi:hypothetical protein